MNDNQTMDFNAIRQDELSSIKKSPQDKLVGLALSGGGIRSATFNLGVIQGLAKHNVLTKFDYLSTVSGGGYIGSWLSALIYHDDSRSIDSVQTKIKDSLDEKKPEANSVKFLRNYSNYLTPKTGLLSMDTLTAISTYLRNLILTQSIFILTLALILMIPMLLHSLVGDIVRNKENINVWIIILAFGSLLFAVWRIASTLYETSKEKGLGSGKVFLQIVLPIAVSAVSFSLLLHSQSLNTASIIPMFGIGYLFIWLLTAAKLHFQSSDKSKLPLDYRSVGSFLVFTFLAGCIGGTLFFLVAKFLSNPLPDDSNLISWTMLVIGPSVVLAIFSLSVIFHIGLVGKLFSDKQHEWWARLGAPLLIISLGWTGLFGIAVFSPAVIEWLHDTYLVPALASGWIGATITGLIAAKNSGATVKDDTTLSLILQKITPYVFVLGLLVAISCAIQWLPNAVNKEPIDFIRSSCHISNPPQFSRCFSSFLNKELEGLTLFDKKPFGNIDTWYNSIFKLWVGMFAIALLLAWRVNVNLFSMHHFYRNRLIRAYLGASRQDKSEDKRTPHPFTGFDENDDIRIKDLAGQRPYHIINTSINLTKGQELAYQNRQAQSFIFTPKYCGYQTSTGLHYCHTDEYGIKNSFDERGYSLGTAVAISGAAANPMMGYHTSPALSFLLAIFNVRLGRWCSNPNSKCWKDADPMVGYWYLLKELFGFASEKDDFVQLSDGGHFENMGLYELVRRGCDHIVVCDAGADSKAEFEDLANAIRKCRTDFGVEIEINVDKLRHTEQNRNCSEHYALGKIIYKRDDREISKMGTLILLKPSLTESIPVDVRQYADANPDFPQQTTADQWFDDAQFESYRKLGNHVVDSLFKHVSAEKIAKYGL